MIEASGCIFLSLSTGRVMMQQRSNSVTHPNTWGFFGGKQEKNERPIETLYRELSEELGDIPEIKKVIPISKFTSANGKFTYHNFVAIINDEFVPILNSESAGFCWVDIGHWPKPLHPGAKVQCNSIDFIKKIKTIYETQIAFE